MGQESFEIEFDAARRVANSLTKRLAKSNLLLTLLFTASRYMFDLRGKKKHTFGSVDPRDDSDIDILSLRSESRQGIWSEALRLVRDIFLIVVVFILFGVFFVQPVVVEGTSMLPQLHDGERLLGGAVFESIQNLAQLRVHVGNVRVVAMSHLGDQFRRGRDALRTRQHRCFLVSE